MAPVSAAGGEVLTFKLAGERFALAVNEVTEIIRPRDITRVPLGPANLLGVTNLRGLILPVISLVGLLGGVASGTQPGSRVLVLDGAAPVGLLVDEVSALADTSDARRIDLDTLLAGAFGNVKHASHQIEQLTGAEPTRTVTSVARRDTLALIAFTLAGQEYALPLERVIEVTALATHLAEVPHTDQAMLGATAFRGGLLPLVSLRVLLGLAADGFDRRRARVIVTRVGTTRVGLVADAMNAIERVDEDVIDPVPSVLTRGAGEAQIEAICRLEQGRRLVSILSTAKLFDAGTAARIAASAKEGASAMPARNGGEFEQFVLFSLGREQYGLPIGAVDEVVRCPDALTRVPGAPSFVEGVMNLRGKIVPVIDQRLRFASDGAGARNRRVVVMTIDGLQAGFVVDGISEILSAKPDELSAAPQLTADGMQIFDRVARLERDGRIILLIAPKALLDQAARDVLAAIAGELEAVPLS
jgi:purine-binding chemotaxis protein CheW